MIEPVIPSDDFSAFFAPAISAVITTDIANVPRPASPIIKEEGSDEIAAWGDSNDFPQQVIADVRKDPELPAILDKKAKLLYSGGLQHGKLTINDKGEEVLTPLDQKLDLEIKTWRRTSNLNRYIYECAKDLYWFYNAFPEIVLSTDRKKIIQLCVQPAEISRWKKQNTKGLVETCYINANFPDAEAKDKETVKLSVLDPYYDPASFLRLKTETNFIYPLSIPTPGSNLYQLADWNSIRSSGWLAISQAIPKFKKSVLDKQSVIKYHIEISDQFWIKKYDGFEEKSPAEKAIIKKTEIDKFQQIMSGAEQSGGNLYTTMITDVAMSKEYSLWKVTVLDDKLKAGTFLEEGKDASIYKYSAMAVHPALIGTMPNNGMGGAGSNIREAYTLHMMTEKAVQDIILEPLENVVNPYNGWDECTWRFKNSFMNTLDKGSETTKTVA